jgi:hypothetical protein
MEKEKPDPLPHDLIRRKTHNPLFGLRNSFRQEHKLHVFGLRQINERLVD